MSEPIALSAGTIAAAMNGRLVAGDDDRYVTGFSIDSRTLASGDLFFAIVAKRDGHDFAAVASRRRAAGLVVSRPVALGDENESFVVAVTDTTRALQDLARARPAEVDHRPARGDIGEPRRPIRRQMLNVTGTLEWVDFTGQTPFIRAALAGDITAMKLLLAKGAVWRPSLIDQVIVRLGLVALAEVKATESSAA